MSVCSWNKWHLELHIVVIFIFMCEALHAVEALHALTCLSHCLGIRLSHCGIVSKRHKLESQNLYCELPQEL